MTKYQILLNVLDKIIEDNKGKNPKLYSIATEEKINQSRARAFIHLFIKVKFGILDFAKREYFLTDKSNDGGIDGYYIDESNRKVFFFQSKFRIGASNFESKKIDFNDILKMDIRRIVKGHTTDESGTNYNGKILQLQRDLKKTNEIARFEYEVIILANLDKRISGSKLKLLFGGYSYSSIGFEECYQDFLLPILKGTFFNEGAINLSIDLKNKDSGAKIDYNVQTEIGSCNIKVVFVPTIEIAKILFQYKNSILKYNPRSYLELEGKKVNGAIRETILENSSNEFALLNNGITMFADEVNFSDATGEIDTGKLFIQNPQIINGGQTAYTLSKIYEENISEEIEKVFSGKEVMLKVISIIGNSIIEPEERENLIQKISKATNSQTPVLTSDKSANEIVYQNVQKSLFEKYGLILERKRGEFESATNNFVSPQNGRVNLEKIIF